MKIKQSTKKIMLINKIDNVMQLSNVSTNLAQQLMEHDKKAFTKYLCEARQRIAASYYEDVIKENAVEGVSVDEIKVNLYNQQEKMNEEQNGSDYDIDSSTGEAVENNVQSGLKYSKE
jgi:formylmethanofuran dehydrogenase subunit E-like metal-binding protein